MSTARFIVADVFDGLRSLPDNSVDLVMTSPPFLALRSYLPSDHPEKGKEIGSEPTPGEFLDVLLDVVVECRRVLAPHGSLVFELGDTYAGSGGAGGDYNEEGLRSGQPVFQGSAGRRAARTSKPRPSPDGIDFNGARRHEDANMPKRGNGWPLDKSLCGIPTLFKDSLAYGRNLLTGRELEPWRIRNFIPWCRPNPPVGALGDKFRPATSYLTVACMARDRFFDLDAVREQLTERAQAELDSGGVMAGESYRADPSGNGYGERTRRPAAGGGAPPLDYWVIPTAPYKGSHYATFPPELCIKPVKAMCPDRVCRVCGEPSRRKLSEQPEEAAQRLLAAEIESCRKGRGVTRAEMVPWFPHYKNAESIRAQVSNWELAKNVPSEGDWQILKDRLGVSDDFDVLIAGDRRWTESLVEYEHHSDHPSGLTQDARGRLYRRLSATKSRISPDGWTVCDCACATDVLTKWRPGVVLDPFAGSGTTLLVATGHGRDAIGIDLDDRNAELARERLGMFLTVESLAIADTR